MSEEEAKSMFDHKWFKNCADPTHPMGPHIHMPSGAIKVTEDAIIDAANTLAFPETDERIVSEALKKFNAKVDPSIRTATSEELFAEHDRLNAKEFRLRVAALLKRIEFGEGAWDGCGGEWCSLCHSYGDDGKHEDDCAIAALLKECEE